MARPFRLVVFDCDGVLVDTERIAVGVDVEVLARLGWPLSREEVIERFVGRADEYVRTEIEAHLGRKLPDDFNREYSSLYRAAFDRELGPIEGVVDALDRIKLPTCVASSGSHEKMRYTLGRTGLYERFAGRIFSGDEVEHKKPAPDLFLLAAARMGVDPADCAVVEDSKWGVRAARAAGMRTFAFAGGLTPAHRLEGLNTVVFTRMEELPQLLGG